MCVCQRRLQIIFRNKASLFISYTTVILVFLQSVRQADVSTTVVLAASNVKNWAFLAGWHEVQKGGEVFSFV